MDIRLEKDLPHIQPFKFSCLVYLLLTVNQSSDQTNGKKFNFTRYKTPKLNGNVQLDLPKTPVDAEWGIILSQLMQLQLLAFIWKEGTLRIDPRARRRIVIPLFPCIASSSSLSFGEFIVFREPCNSGGMHRFSFSFEALPNSSLKTST